MDNIEIIHADPRHVSIIAQLVYEHTQGIKHNQNTPEEYVTESYIGKNLGQYFNFLIAIRVGQDRAYLHTSDSATIPSYDDCVGCIMYIKSFRFEHGRHLLLHNMYVKDGYRKMGIGMKLMKQVTKVARAEDASIELVTSVNNSNAVNFYQRLGAEFLFMFTIHSIEKVTLVFSKETINKVISSE